MLRGLHTLSIWALSAILVLTLTTGVIASAKGVYGSAAHADAAAETEGHFAEADAAAAVVGDRKPESKSPCKEGIASCASFTCTAFTVDAAPVSFIPSGLSTALSLSHSVIPDARAPATADEPPRRRS